MITMLVRVPRVKQSDADNTIRRAESVYCTAEGQ